MTKDLDHYADALSRLRRARVGEHSSPHKPALLLAIISLIESGKVKYNRIEYDQALLQLFRRYFEKVRSHRDAVNSMDPFWRLRTDGFFHHHPKPGHEAAVRNQRGAPTLGQLHEISDYSFLDDDLFELLRDPTKRRQLRETLVSTYFPDKAKEIARVAKEERSIKSYEDYLEARMTGRTQDASEPKAAEYVRDAAFGRIVREAYDYQCAACGLRIIVADLALVDAAHIVPLHVSGDNDPRNGMALCKNHHWALDSNLMAPFPDLKWHTHKNLDSRLAGHEELKRLDGQSIILPRKPKYHPKKESLAWRKAKLREAGGAA